MHTLANPVLFLFKIFFVFSEETSSEVCESRPTKLNMTFCSLSFLSCSRTEDVPVVSSMVITMLLLRLCFDELLVLCIITLEENCSSIAAVARILNGANGKEGFTEFTKNPDMIWKRANEVQIAKIRATAAIHERFSSRVMIHKTRSSLPL